KLFYPSSNDPATFSEEAATLKIARHLPCSTCDVACTGLHPGPTEELVRDDQQLQNYLTDLAQYGSDDEDTPSDYLRLCACGHDAQEHGANAAELGHEEYARRVRIAARIDEYLERSGKLLDFGYTDAQVRALRDELRLSDSLVS
ncbi:hypothetical protein BV25DRAFT_1776601, partial [Artomyces pyxidatus]